MLRWAYAGDHATKKACYFEIVFYKPRSIVLQVCMMLSSDLSSNIILVINTMSEPFWCQDQRVAAFSDASRLLRHAMLMKIERSAFEDVPCCKHGTVPV
jgi:hypothetical protein